MGSALLTINGGSSSVKFALFSTAGSLKRVLTGSIERIGLSGARLTIKEADGKGGGDQNLSVGNHSDAGKIVIDVLRKRGSIDSVGAIGHRIVHGGPRFLDHAPINGEMLAELRRVSAIDPEHLPGELVLIETFSSELPGVVQIACFDTAFHRDLPVVAKTLPIPRKYKDLGMRRYGFHGLSYTYLLEELRRQELADGDQQQKNPRRVILAHLGNGCSMTAVSDGKSIDTTMSFTPTAGLVMGTRTGDLDPGALIYLMHKKKSRSIKSIGSSIRSRACSAFRVLARICAIC